MSYLAKFSKIVTGEEEVFNRWMKSDLTNNHTNEEVHYLLIQKLDDEQLESSGFVFQCFVDGVLEYIKLMIFKLLRGLSCQKKIRIVKQL